MRIILDTNHPFSLRHDLFQSQLSFIHLYNKERRGYLYLYNDNNTFTYSIKNQIVTMNSILFELIVIQSDELSLHYYSKYVTHPSDIKNQSYILLLLNVCPHLTWNWHFIDQRLTLHLSIPRSLLWSVAFFFSSTEGEHRWNGKEIRKRCILISLLHHSKFYDALYVYYTTSFLKYWSPVIEYIDSIPSCMNWCFQYML